MAREGEKGQGDGLDSVISCIVIKHHKSPGKQMKTEHYGLGHAFEPCPQDFQSDKFKMFIMTRHNTLSKQKEIGFTDEK